MKPITKAEKARVRKQLEAEIFSDRGLHEAARGIRIQRELVSALEDVRTRHGLHRSELIAVLVGLISRELPALLVEEQLNVTYSRGLKQIVVSI